MLKDNQVLSQSMRVRSSTEYVHTVTDGCKRFIVCLRKRNCTCGRFQLDELPCGHALAVLRSRNLRSDEYCSAYYTRANLLKIYEIPVDPLPDESEWNIPFDIAEEEVLPRTGKRAPGRPHKPRYKTFNEVRAKKYKVLCSNCGRLGHNKKTCRNVPKRK
uniref:SWIM-type domain-containing protein n=1 Tax=Nicotiana tabacum TaxID=4097 RepID=A0A1S4CH01_TOBAC|nr:PREDICTED: uncharacterized protein LOC107818888 [Nicotiana tabacum]